MLAFAAMKLLRTLLLTSAVACGGTTQAPIEATGPAAQPTDAPRTVEVPPEEIEGSSPYPPSPREDIVDELHGVKVADPYRWLEDATKPEVQQWVEAQASFARKTLDAIPQRAELVARFTELYYLDSVSSPVHRRGRYFYTRRHKDKEKTVVYWKKGDKGAEQVLFDPNTWSEDGSVSMGGWFPSWNGKLVAYKKKENNADEATFYLRDVDSGKDSEIDVIPGAKFASASWTPDNKGFYYTWYPTDASIPVHERPGHAVVRFHKIGTDPATDEVVFPATGDPQMFIGGGVTRDGRWLMIYVSSGWSKTDVFIKDLRRKARKPVAVDPAALEDLDSRARAAKHAEALGFTPLVQGIDAIFSPTWWRGSFYVHTNFEAPRYRVFKVNPSKLAMKDWKEIIPQSADTMESAEVIGGRLVVSYLRNATTAVDIHDLDGKKVRTLELPAIGSAGVGGEPDEDTFYYGFSNFTTPTQIYKSSIKSGKSELWAKVEVPVDTSKLEVKQVWYPSKDGTEISMFIIHSKDTKLDGNNPALLYGYGGFNVSLTPGFSSMAAVWAERGGVYAIANLRGGGEYGEAWHDAGKLGNKQNVFDDFAAAAEYLIAQGYTKPEKLAVYGGSNGGLLVGAVMTQRPELFGAVVCAVPLLDMVRYHKFGLGQAWIPEYGSADDPGQFTWLHAYSPYHHVKQGTPYPALLMLAADSDDRVDPLHARKFTAAIQWATASADRPVIMRVERNAGHGGADLIKKSVESSADIVAFLLWQLGK